MKKTIAAILALILSFSLFTTGSFAEEDKDDKSEEEEEVSEKELSYSAEEVIYGVLNSDGRINKILPVVILDAKEDTELTYYGEFKNVINLTDTNKLQSKGDKLKLKLEKGRFYFEAQLKKAEIPWNVDISYMLDGKKISPEKLGGKSGKLQIQIDISANEKADKSFFDAYMLQLSATLNSEKCKNIVAEGATMANAGSNKMINFMSMPGSQSSFKISADVEDFSMGGMSIAAVPMSMAEMLGSMDGISEGLDQFGDAMGQLSSGVSQLNSGAWQLSDGMRQFSQGLLMLSENSAPIRDTSQMMLDALIKADEFIADITGDNMGELNPNLLPDALRRTADCIYLAADSVNGERNNLASAVDNMNFAFTADRSEINEAGLAYIENLQNSWNYSAVLIDNTITKLEIVERDIRLSGDGVMCTADNLEKLVNSGGLESVDISEYIYQIRDLLQKFQMFYDGIIQYTGAVDMLAENSVAISNGVLELAGGTNQLDSGTSQIPEQMDKMISEMVGEEFEPHSFISEKNENVKSVQFVFSTEAISLPQPPEEESESAEAMSGIQLFFSKLKALFNTATE